MENLFEPYEPPNQSRLEKWKPEIQKMRSLNWPYHKIAKWLEEEQQCKVHKDTIRKFCIVRKIKKGSSVMDRDVHASSSSTFQSAQKKISPKGRESSKRKFSFTKEDEKPIDIHPK